MPTRGVGIHGVQMTSQALGLALHWALSLGDQPLWAPGPLIRSRSSPSAMEAAEAWPGVLSDPGGQSCSENTGRGVLGADLGGRGQEEGQA